MDRYWQQPGNEYRRRAFQALDEAEESQRASLERKYEDLQEVLIQLAHALRGEAIEKVRHDQPKAPHNWTPSDWRKFWFEETRIVSPVVAKTWKEIAKEEAEKNPAVLGMPAYNMLDVHRALQATACVEDMQKAMEAVKETHRNEISEKNQHILNLQTANKGLKALTRQAQDRIPEQSAPRPVTPESESDTKAKIESTGVLFAKELSVWKSMRVSDNLPENWKKEFKKQQTTSRILTAFEILFAIHTCSISNSFMIDWLVSTLQIHSPANTKPRRIMHDLKQEGIIVEKTMFFSENAVKTTVAFMHLTEKGRQLCADWNIPPSTSQSNYQYVLGKGMFIDDPRVRLLLAFSVYAELRNWECKGIQEDFTMLIEKGEDKRVIITIPKSIGDGEIQKQIREIPADTPIGIVAISPDRRVSIEKWCKENTTANIVFTDIKHLIDKEPDTEKITAFSIPEYVDGLPLWLE